MPALVRSHALMHLSLIFNVVSCCFAGEVGKLLGAKWKELDDSEKKVRLTHTTWILTPPILLISVDVALH